MSAQVHIEIETDDKAEADRLSAYLEKVLKSSDFVIEISVGRNYDHDEDAIFERSLIAKRIAEIGRKLSKEEKAMTLKEAQQQAYSHNHFIVHKSDCFLLYRSAKPKNVFVGKRKNEKDMISLVRKVCA